MDCLVQHIRPALEGNDFDFAAVAGEWSALKDCVTANNFRHLDPLILWQRIFTAFKDQFPNILMLVEIILILSLSAGFATIWPCLIICTLSVFPNCAIALGRPI